MALAGTYFSSSYYLTANVDVANNWSGTALSHYQAYGASENRAPNSWFNAQYYRATYSDLATMTAIQLFEHYENFGYKETRTPSSAYANFDEATYLSTYSDLGAAGITTGSALNHYLNFGINEGRVGKNDDGSSTSSTTGTTFTLTEASNTFTGTAGNDRFDGSLATTAAGRLMTFGNSDSLDGGAGTDTLFVQNNIAAATTITPVSAKNIEVLDLDNSAQGGFAFTVSLQNGDSGLTTVTSANNTTAAATVVVSNVQGVPTTVNLSNTNQNFTLQNTASKMTGTTDAVTVNLMSVTAGTVSLGTTAAGSGYETINLVSGGSIANTLTGITDGLGNSLTTINVTGAMGLTATLGDTTVTKFDASAFTGALNFTGFAGSGAQNIIGGTANDVIAMAGTYTSSDTINGGTGTDRMTLTNAEATAATAAQSNVSNVEIIGLSNGISGTVTVGNFSATGLRFGAAMAAAGTAAYAAGTNTLDLQNFASGGFNLTVNVAGTATTDVLGLTVGSTAAGNTFGAGTVTINGAETVNLMSQGGANTFGAAFTMTDTAATQALVITGTQNAIFTGAVRADSINASGLTTGGLQLNGGTSTTATAITGSGQADTLVGSTAGDIISGGAGADLIENVLTGTAATAADLLTGGAGYDTFTLRGDTAQAATAVATAYALAPNITDFTVGSTTTTTDIISLSTTVGNYAGFSAFHAGIGATTAVAAGSTVIMGVAQNSAAAQGLTASTDLIKLTTGVAPAGTLQAAFNAAIGTATITVGANTDGFVSFYDTTNSKMVLCTVDSAGGAATTAIETADVVTLIGTIDMTAADYAAFSNVNLALVVA